MKNFTTTKHSRNIENKVLEAVINYIEEHNYPPTVREIGELVGLKSPSSVQTYLNRLFSEGRLETDAQTGSPRAIRVPGYKFIKMQNTN